MSWLNLEGKVAVVTGSAGGIGKAVSVGLAEVGAKIVVADINLEGAEATAAELKDEFGVELRQGALHASLKPSHLPDELVSFWKELGQVTPPRRRRRFKKIKKAKKATPSRRKKVSKKTARFRSRPAGGEHA